MAVFTRRRRARTLAGDTRAFSSAYHRDYDATEIRTLKGCRNSSHPAGVRMAFAIIIPVVTLAALANHRLLSGHASGVRKWPNSRPLLIKPYQGGDFFASPTYILH